ncbi:hypothetical protein [Nonomuraea sp. NPDC049695]|uniref:hypothetical protein n=1 Tax=Nonomuraea sp. NPDC049695 TaxID=3154734 RepID=UPI0034320398
MHPDLYLYVERTRADELRADADRHRLASPPSGSAVRTLEERVGWALVETGLRLVYRHY